MATPGVVLVAARVVGHDADGCRSQRALLPAETDPKIRFAVRKVFPLGPDVDLLHGYAWRHGHRGLNRRPRIDGCRSQHALLPAETDPEIRVRLDVFTSDRCISNSCVFGNE